MSATKVTDALSEIDKVGLERRYLNKKFCVSEEEICEAESRLGYKFPVSYRFFLRTLGSGDFQATEFYGLVPNQLDIEEIPNGLWYTQDLRENMGLPKTLFAFQDFDGDAVACLLLSEMHENECPVVLWDHGEAKEKQIQKPHILAETFGDYFLTKIRELVQDAGTS